MHVRKGEGGKGGLESYLSLDPESRDLQNKVLKGSIKTKAGLNRKRLQKKLDYIVITKFFEIKKIPQGKNKQGKFSETLDGLQTSKTYLTTKSCILAITDEHLEQKPQILTKANYIECPYLKY